MSRPDKIQYLMGLAAIAALRSTCDRRSVGCVLTTPDGRILSTGYNGSMPGSPHCDDVGHLMHDGHCVRTVHAEANAISLAARQGIPLAGAHAYVTTQPCMDCLKLLVSAGIRSIWYADPYTSDEHSDGTSPAMVSLIEHAQNYGIVMHPVNDLNSWMKGLTGFFPNEWIDSDEGRKKHKEWFQDVE